MNVLRLISLLATCFFLGAAQELSPIPTENPEQIGGRWETATPSGVEGIGFEVLTASTGQMGTKSERFDWQSISIRVYTRESGQETWGYFAARYKATPKSYEELLDGHSFDLFDGRRLRIHSVEFDGLKQFDLDLTLSPSANIWYGTWSRPGQNEHVVLTRPSANATDKPNPIVGQWIGEPIPNSSRFFEPSTLDIRQSADGVLSVWLDRTSTAIDLHTGVMHNERRNGEQLNVESRTDAALVLNTNHSAGAHYQYRATLSADGQLLTGNWGAPGGGGRLAAAEQFRRAPKVAD
jgi:hypothetical protein